MSVSIIQGEDKEFTIRLVSESTQEPFDLSGLTADQLELKMPGENETITLTLDDNGNASLLTIVSALGGKFKATISDTDSALLKDRENQDMEITIKKGVGPDFDITKVQLLGQLTVKKTIFE